MKKAERRRCLQRQESSVEFAKESTIVHLIERVPDEAKEDLWFKKDEYESIRKRDLFILKLVEDGTFQESEEHTFRGLEDRCLENGFDSERTLRAIQAVLQEQQRQYENSMRDPELVANQYILALGKSRKEARARAKEDALHLKEEHESNEESSSSIANNARRRKMGLRSFFLRQSSVPGLDCSEQGAYKAGDKASTSTEKLARASKKGSRNPLFKQSSVPSLDVVEEDDAQKVTDAVTSPLKKISDPRQMNDTNRDSMEPLAKQEDWDSFKNLLSSGKKKRSDKNRLIRCAESEKQFRASLSSEAGPRGRSRLVQELITDRQQEDKKEPTNGTIKLPLEITFGTDHPIQDRNGGCFKDQKNRQGEATPGKATPDSSHKTVKSSSVPNKSKQKGPKNRGGTVRSSCEKDPLVENQNSDDLSTAVAAQVRRELYRDLAEAQSSSQKSGFGQQPSPQRLGAPVFEEVCHCLPSDEAKVLKESSRLLFSLQDSQSTMDLRKETNVSSAGCSNFKIQTDGSPGNIGVSDYGRRKKLPSHLLPHLNMTRKTSRSRLDDGRNKYDLQRGCKEYTARPRSQKQDSQSSMDSSELDARMRLPPHTKMTRQSSLSRLGEVGNAKLLCGGRELLENGSRMHSSMSGLDMYTADKVGSRPRLQKQDSQSSFSSSELRELRENNSRMHASFSSLDIRPMQNTPNKTLQDRRHLQKTAGPSIGLLAEMEKLECLTKKFQKKLEAQVEKDNEKWLRERIDSQRKGQPQLGAAGENVRLQL